MPALSQRFPWFGSRVRPHVTFVRGPIVASEGAVNNEAVPSISLAYLSGAVQSRGFTFTWVDAIADGLGQYWPVADFPGYRCQGSTIEDIVGAVPAQTGVIAINAMFSGEWPVTRTLIRALRARFPEALIVAGGEHATALSEFSLRDCRDLDLCVRGEGEQILLDLLEGFTEGRAIDEIGGIAYLDPDGSYCQSTGLTRIRDASQVPWPHWPEGYLERFWKAGKSAGVLTDRDMPMIVSRGCPYQCTFCSSPNMWTTRYVLRDVDDVIAEIKQHVARYDITSVQLYDLTAITKKRWTIEFCERLLAEGINLNWSVPQGTRSEILDEETLSLLKRTGCHYLVYAPESGSPRTLERIKKRVNLDNLVLSVKEARRQGLVLRINLIIGFPGETRRDVLLTALFGIRMVMQGVDEISTNIFSPYPGSAMFDELHKAGRIELTDEYFMRLTSLNSDFLRLNPLTFNDSIGPRELACYRIALLLSCYFLSYALFPARILRTWRNWRSGKAAATVFEHRVGDFLKRRFSRQKRSAVTAAE
jgi:anaerobic magnesium-protoporphyrin IX monomethyl ester cyclase